MPIVRRKQPRPPKNVARSYRSNRDGRTILDRCFQSDFPLLDQIKAIGWIALAKNNFTSPEARRHRAIGHDLQLLGSQILQEGMLRNLFRERRSWPRHRI